MSFTEAQIPTLNHIRERPVDAPTARLYARTRAHTYPGETDEEIAEHAAQAEFWNHIADLIERGEADWL